MNEDQREAVYEAQKSKDVEGPQRGMDPARIDAAMTRDERYAILANLRKKRVRPPYPVFIGSRAA